MALKGTKALLVWSQRCTEEYKEVKVDNMTKSWRDGMAFCAIIHHFRPDLLDFYSLSKENVQDNCSLAFDVAERELGIPSLLDPEDMAAMLVPDKLSIMTYVSQYYNFFKDKKPANKEGKEPKSKGSKLSLKRSHKKSKDKDSKDGATPTKQATMGDKCKMCGKHVYMIERQVVDGKLYHRACFKCSKCSTTLRPGSYKNTKDPKKFECLHHSQSNDMQKLRSKMANRAGSRLAGGGNYEDTAIWQMQRSKSVGKPPGKPPAPPSQCDDKPPLHPAAQPTTTPPGRIRLMTQPAAFRPVSKPPPVPSPANTGGAVAAIGIALHPHLLAASSARSQFGATTDPAPPVSTKDGSLKDRPVSKETNIEDVAKGSEIPPAQPAKKTSIDSTASKDGSIDTSATKETVLDAPASKETSIDDVTSDLNKTQDTTGDSMSLKSGTSDSTSTTSREGMTTSQDSLLKNSDTNMVKKDEVVIKTLNGNKDENMNAAEKSDEEKEFMASVRKYEVTVDVKVGSVMNEQKNKVIEEGVRKENNDDSLNPFGDENELSSEEKKGEKWEHELVKEKDTIKGESSKLDNEEKHVKDGTKEAEPHMIINEPQAADNGDSSNPFGDDFEEEEGVVESKQTTELEINEEEENKKNEKTLSEDDVLKKDNKGTPGAGNAEVARLAVQSKELGDAAKSGSSIDDVYDNDLNPFGDEEEEEESKSPKEYNPFDESDEDEDEDYDNSLNPFGDDGEEEDTMTTNGALNPFMSSRPSRPPPPRATQDQSSSFQVKSRQQILQEMHVNRNTIKIKKKRPAPRRPPPPGPPGAAGSPSPAKDGVQAPPRKQKKNRRAPPPPPTGSTPQKTTPERPPPITVSPSPDQNGSKPVPSPRLSLFVESADNNNSPNQSKPRLIVTTENQGSASSDGEDRSSPMPSTRQSRRATTCGVRVPRKGGVPIQRIGSHSPSRGSSKRKAPLPPAIKRDVTKDHEDPMQIQNQLTDNEKCQRELEQRGIGLENKLRTTMEAAEGEQENEDILIEWFKLVNDRNKLIRKEGEFIAQLQMQELEVQHAEIEYELRCLMNKPEHERIDADQEKEEKLLEMLVEVVTSRSSVVDRLESDRIKEEEEDENIRQMMAESGLTKETKDTEGKKKKDKKKKKDHKTTWHVR